MLFTPGYVLFYRSWLLDIMLGKGLSKRNKETFYIYERSKGYSMNKSLN